MPVTVAMAAIKVEGMAQRLGARPNAAPARQSSIWLMRMVVGSRDRQTGFMPTIAGDRRPAELKRQQYKQQDRQPAAH